MRVVVVSLLLLLALPEVALSARWEKDTIPVWDFTPDEWRPNIQRAIDDFNANMPLEVPRLNYIPMGGVPCEALPPHGRKGGISVCLRGVPTGTSNTGIDYVGKRISRVKVSIDPSFAVLARHNVCHEMMHAVTDAPDAFPYPHPTASCVQGSLDHLGPWDIAFAEAAYSVSSSRGAHRHHGRHH